MSWFVYIVGCADKTYYTGIAVDLSKRIEKHNSGKGAAYTGARVPVALLYSEEYPDRSAASKRECAIKRLTRAQKTELILKKPTKKPAGWCGFFCLRTISR